MSSFAGLHHHSCKLLMKFLKHLMEYLYIARAIDGSYIPIIAPIEHAVDYYCRKGFHSVLLQGIVDYFYYF